MTNFQETAGRVAVEALRAEFTDAGMMGDYDRFAGLFTADGSWRMPHLGATYTGRAAIREAIERLRGVWRYSVHHDRYLRTADGRRFTERVYEIRYADATPLTGAAPDGTVTSLPGSP
jgi:hypothetical protein